MTKLAIRTVVATLSGISWVLAAVSLLGSTTFLWHAYESFQHLLLRAGLAGRGHCWLCGMSHSFRSIWHGDFDAAISHNPHSLALFAYMLVGCASVGMLWMPSLRNRPNQPMKPTAPDAMSANDVATDPARAEVLSIVDNGFFALRE